MQEQPENVIGTLDRAFDRLRQARENFTPQLAVQETGTILTVSAGVATVAGLPRVGFEELIRFPGDLFGLAFNLNEG
jgi:F-type H+-transporting ATPase subunit alpha